MLKKRIAIFPALALGLVLAVAGSVHIGARDPADAAPEASAEPISAAGELASWLSREGRAALRGGMLDRASASAALSNALHPSEEGEALISAIARRRGALTQKIEAEVSEASVAGDPRRFLRAEERLARIRAEGAQ
ncbi:MAG: hypothetical protein V2A66_07545 [Pseudomonadota bacterium]